MTERDLTVTTQRHSAGPCLLSVGGELDHHTAPLLRESIYEIPLTPSSPLVIDLSKLTYCDSTGITVLITAHHRAQAAGAPLALAGLSPDLNRVLQIVGLDQVFTFYPTADEAVQALQP